MSEKLSPMQKAARDTAEAYRSDGEGPAGRALRRMDATAREIMAALMAMAASMAAQNKAWQSSRSAAGWAYDAAETLERERERRMQLPEEDNGSV